MTTARAATGWINVGRWLDWLPVLMGPPLVMACSGNLARWERMWLVCLGLFFGFKWLSLSRFAPARRGVSRMRSLAYLGLWPDMNPRPCLASRRQTPAPMARQWLFAGAKPAVGLALFALAAPPLVGRWPLAAGWVALTGLALILHFGLFDLLALAWRQFGFDARPIMNRPLAARSLAEFWGRRWNLAFRQLAHGLMFLPLAGRIGNQAALVASFVFSGFVHEIAISMPAGAGFGLPMTYFLIQAAGLLLERSGMGRRAGLNHGALGRAYTAAVVLLPVGLVFHRPFIFAIILPMLRTISG